MKHRHQSAAVSAREPLLGAGALSKAHEFNPTAYLDVGNADVEVSGGGDGEVRRCESTPGRRLAWLTLRNTSEIFIEWSQNVHNQTEVESM